MNIYVWVACQLGAEPRPTGWSSSLRTVQRLNHMGEGRTGNEGEREGGTGRHMRDGKVDHVQRYKHNKLDMHESTVQHRKSVCRARRHDNVLSISVCRDTDGMGSGWNYQTGRCVNMYVCTRCLYPRRTRSPFVSVRLIFLNSCLPPGALPFTACAGSPFRPLKPLFFFF